MNTALHQHFAKFEQIHKNETQARHDALLTYTETDIMDLLTFFKNLAEETRLRCLLLIAHEGELCVCELTTALEEVQPKVSRHLAILKRTGLLLDRKEGLWVYYRLNPNIPSWAKHALYTAYKENQDFIAHNIARLNTMGTRPERASACN